MIKLRDMKKHNNNSVNTHLYKQSNLLWFTFTLLISSLYSLTAHAERFLTEDGASISYEVTGEGAPVVLLHSGMMSREDMREQITHLSKQYQVIALDSRGQGRSSKAETPMSYRRLAADVVGLLNSLKIKRAHVIGQSAGGITALFLARYHPDYVNKLVTLGANYHVNAHPKESLKHLASFKFDASNQQHTDPSQFPGLMIESYKMSHPDLSGFGERLSEMLAMWTTSPTFTASDLAQITQPALVINGDRYDVPLEHVLSLYQGLPNAQLFIMPNGDHYLHQTAPEILHAVIDRFLLTP